MPRGATDRHRDRDRGRDRDRDRGRDRDRDRGRDRDRDRQSSGRPPSEDTEQTQADGSELTVMTAGRPASSTLWSAVVLSVLGSAVAVAAVGSFCALIYPILKELRVERVRGQDGTEQRILGFWSITVLSVLVGCICCVFSWTLTYLDSQQPGSAFPKLTLARFRQISGDGFHMGYAVAVLNGIMAMLTVIWSLT